MPRNLLTPDALTMMDVIARTGSFAAAAREMGKVPSALTYSVRQLEDALDVLLFDRRTGQAKLTAAGIELLHEGRRVLEQLDAVANRVKRVATGWETQLTIAVDDALSRLTVFELCEDFYALRPEGPGTRMRLRTEVLAGTWEALVSGQADLALGVTLERAPPAGVKVEPLGTMGFVFAVAPHHPLANFSESITDTVLVRYRAVAVADSAHRLTPVTVNLLPGQDVFTVPTMQAKLEAQLRCLGCGFLPEPVAREHIAAGRLVVKTVERSRAPATFSYAWRVPSSRQPIGDPRAMDAGLIGGSGAAGGTGKKGSNRSAPVGLALRWWLDRLANPETRLALLERHTGPRLLGF
jgi:DNA-binding transcriptional LysR family regulator